MKKSIPIKQFWYSDVVVFPKIVTIITTVNEAGDRSTQHPTHTSYSMMF